MPQVYYRFNQESLNHIAALICDQPDLATVFLSFLECVNYPT